MPIRDKQEDRQTELVKTILLFLDANIKPPESFLEDVFSYATKRGCPQEQITELKRLISTLPLRELQPSTDRPMEYTLREP